MSLKDNYRRVIEYLNKLPQKIRVQKQYIGEIVEINRMNSAVPVKGVKLKQEDKEKAEEYWKKHYGKRIPLKWHRKYYAFSGKFDPRYFPEILYTTKLEPLLNDDHVARVLSDKNMTEILFEKVISKEDDVTVPTTVCGCDNGFYFDKDRRPISQKQLFKELHECDNELIIKPSIGESSGHGVKLIKARKGIDEITGDTLENIILMYGKNFILQERIIQHDEYARIHPESINTIRVMTYRTNECIKAAPAVMRIGVGKSYLDNAHAGGIYVGVSKDGVLQRNAMRNYHELYEFHPDTKIQFEGYRIPFVERILEVAKKMHECLPQIGFVNWDFCVNHDSKIVLIESNLMCGGIWIFENAWGQTVRKLAD